MTQVEDWPRLRSQVLDSLRVLVSLLESETSQPRLIEGYLDSKRLLALSFQALLRERIRGRLDLLVEVKTQIADAANTAFSGGIPEKYLRVRGYNSPHRELFAYLTLFVGRPVPGTVLRILTADAVHTERRARELRDLGVQLEAVRTGGVDVYVLQSTKADIPAATRWVVQHNISEDRDLGKAERERYLQIAEE